MHRRIKNKTLSYEESVLFNAAILNWAIFLILILLEVFRILKIDENSVLFEVALLEDLFDNLFLSEWALTLEDLLDHVADDARLVSPLAERVHAAADEHEASILDELVVTGCRVTLLEEGISDSLGYFTEVHR